MNAILVTGHSPVKDEADRVVELARELDPSEYLHELDDFDICEEQKMELLGILFSISRTMVELGFSTELRQVICEQLFDGVDDISDQFANAVESGRVATSETKSTVGEEIPHDE